MGACCGQHDAVSRRFPHEHPGRPVHPRQQPPRQGHLRAPGGQPVRAQGRQLDTPRQPLVGLDPVRRPAPADRGHLEPGLDRLVVPGRGRRRPGLHDGQPAAVPGVRLDPELGLQERLRRAHLVRPGHRRAAPPVRDLQGAGRLHRHPGRRGRPAGLRAGQARPAERGRRPGPGPDGQGLVPRPDGAAVRGHEGTQPRVRRLGALSRPCHTALMDSTAGHTVGTAHDLTPPGSRRGRRRRRPTGEPPPLPRHLESTGVGWMVAAVALITLTLLVFTAGRYGRGISFTVVDNWVVQRLAALRTPGLTSFVRGLSGLIGSLWTVKVLAWSTLIMLVVYKRYRHLIVGLISFQVVTLLVLGLSAAVRRPRSFGVVLEGPWAGWSMPSRPVAYLSAILVTMLYSLVPKGRWRQLGKWVATGLVILLGLVRMYLGVDAPSDVLVAAAIGVTSPCSPTAGSPRARSSRSATTAAAQPTWTWAGPGARPSAAPLPTSSAWRSRRSSRSGCRGRPARPRCASRSRASSATSCSASCTPATTCARTAGTSWAASCCTAASRTRSPSTACAGWSSRRTTPSTSCTRPASRPPSPTASSSSPRIASTCWCRSSSTGP